MSHCLGNKQFSGKNGLDGTKNTALESDALVSTKLKANHHKMGVRVK